MDNYFGSLTPSSNVDLTALLPGLGALAGLGAASGASRLPVTNLSVFGGLAGGLGRGIQAQQQARIQEQQAEMGALRLGLVKQKMNWLSQLFSGNAGTPNGNGASSPANGGAASTDASTPSGADEPVKVAALGSAPVGGAGGTLQPSTATSAPTTANSQLPFPKASPWQNALMMEMFVPGAGKSIIDKYYPGPTDLQRALIAGGINPGSPMGQRLLSLGASRAAGVTSGYQIGANGQESPVAGGDADPRVLAAQQGAEAWAKAPAQAWTSAMAPRTLRGPGSLYVNPYLGETVQVPNEVNYVDPQTLAEKKAFVPLGVEVSRFPGGAGASPTSGFPAGTTVAQAITEQAAGGAPTAAPTGASAPVSASGAAPGVPGTAGETSFMTEAPPGQKEIVEGAAKNYSEEGRKSYESAVDLKSSIAFIKRDLQTMGPQGFLAVGSGAELRGQLARALNTAAIAATGKPALDPNKVGAWEDFEKEATLGGMKGLATIFGGSREAASIVHTSMSAFPHPGNSYAGARLLVSAFDEAANREIDQRNFETNWIPAHGGNLTGAIEAFNSKYPSGSYSQRAISVVQPIKVASPADIKSLLPGTRVLTPDGKVRVIPGTPGVQLQMQASPNG